MVQACAAWTRDLPLLRFDARRSSIRVVRRGTVRLAYHAPLGRRVRQGRTRHGRICEAVMWKRIRELLFGAAKDVHSELTFHSISLVAMLAWVGLGADGLSSSAYGPEAAFRELVAEGHDYSSLAVGLALAAGITVFIISYAYSRIIEHFPSGGGGYVVATKLLGARFGVVSGSALLVDYVLTITVSVAAGGGAIFSMIPRSWFGQEALRLVAGAMGTWSDPGHRAKLVFELLAIPSFSP